MKNPVMTASGTFGSGREYADFINLDRLGAIVVKGVTREPRAGNPTPRICETPSGMLNAIGLQNPGVERFIAEDLKWLAPLGVPVIVNIAGGTVTEYSDVARALSRAGGVAGLEVNISCPNVKKGGISFGCDPEMTVKVVAAVRKAAPGLPLIVKLTPAAGDVVGVAEAAAAAGADALSLINTFPGMSVDTETFEPRLGSATGGLSGPAIRPIAVKMVFDVSRAVRVPIIGMGGISTAQDAIEFMLAGASAVAVGTANFVDPQATIDIIEGLERFVRVRCIDSITSIIGAVKVR
ncbi:MAG: dihydroorotate dehydrogenase [Actinobacteria bacterium]|nr:MAG: dihydroorotate dehydrogenase [Actinomycetota bacterium]